ncbi:hypothetical protein TRAPUB_12576 [Trametes pubescens]|uniref:Uncharacterized protein n=1 Tax=Trametes pubescens TaxID=154538 RepID=A0A1M2VTP9_TRAPU|nr:hypothetical protein TRAPUB_12576 [Trametes pubescens]
MANTISNLYPDIILQARQDIESDIDIYTRAIVDLKSRLNTLTQICRLPPELLSEILVDDAMEVYHSTGPLHTSGFAWIRLAHVCRHFRAVALNTPRFWSYLQITKGGTFAELVARSKNAPLHINAHIHFSTKADRILSLDVLLQHSHHIKELRLDSSVEVIQGFCAKSASGFAILERLHLSAGWSSAAYGNGAPPPIPTITSARDTPSRLRHLKLWRLPFRWSDPVFSSRNLTTLVVVGKQAGERHSASFRNVGSFDDLFSALVVVAPRLKVLDITDALPAQGLSTTSPIALPRPSRSIPFPVLKSLCLAGEGLPLAHLHNHLSITSTASLHLTARNNLGGKELAQSVATNISEKLRLLALCITSPEDGSLLLSGWAHTRTSSDCDADSPFQMHFPSELSSVVLLLPVCQGAGNLFAHVQELRLSGTFMQPTWTDVFSRFASVKTLIVDEHPHGDFFHALTTLDHVPFPSLNVLDLSGFRFSLAGNMHQPFEDLLDWAIFRCNSSIPVDTIRLRACRYASAKRIEALKEVVVHVKWDDWEMESTTEEEDEGSSDEGLVDPWGNRYTDYDDY